MTLRYDWNSYDYQHQTNIVTSSVIYPLFSTPSMVPCIETNIRGTLFLRETDYARQSVRETDISGVEEEDKPINLQQEHASVNSHTKQLVGVHIL